MMIVSSRTLRARLLIGASLGCLLVATVAEAQSGRGRGGAVVDPAAAAARAAQTQATRQAEASSASQRAVAAFRRAAEGRDAMRAAQAAARAAALAGQSGVPNGLGQGGLQVADGVELDPSLWIGANGPTQTTGADGRTVVTVDQTQGKSILTWDSFNVGRETDLVFDQHGNGDWVSLNRLTDANADPTRILGSIKADGSVYIINRNGIIFGGASQVNVRNLVASTAGITNDQFLTRGLYSSLSGGTYVPSFTDAGGAVTVEAGARITTHTPTSVTAGGGFVLLMGTEVTNAGSIATPRGQAALSAGDDFILRRGYGTVENQASTTRGNEVRGLIDAGSTSGRVSNTGQIEAAQGDITLAGRTIRQDGVLVATTGVNQRGTIHLLNSAGDAQGSVTLGADSLTLILPELDSEDTALNSQRDALAKPGQQVDPRLGGFDDRSTLSDRPDQSRVEIVTGGNVVFEGGSQTMANGGQVAVQAEAGRITVEDGASIDVSGVMGVALDMASNSIRVNVQGNELRDSPDNREDDALKNQNVWIDVRDLILLPSGTGGYEGDRWYTPGGLLEVGGYLANTAHGIGEWTAVGGAITLAGREVVAERGAVFDISGGSIDYAAGYVRSSRIMGADGRLYDVRNAPAGMKFVGVGNAFMRQHDRWGEGYGEVFNNRLFSRGSSMRWEDGYSVGRDAGRLILSAPTVVMEGDILADVFNGDRQTQARPDNVTDGYLLGQHTVAKAGTLVLGRFGTVLGSPLYETDVRVGDVDDVTGDLATGAELPADRTNTAWFDAGRLNAQGLGGIELGTRGTIKIESDLVLADAGEVRLFAPVIDIAADITARGGSLLASNFFQGRPDQGGSVTLLQDGAASVTLRDDATLDLRGLWVNAALNPEDTNRLGLIDGGTVRLESTHDVTLEDGSLIDVSSGGAVLEQGGTRGGRGGDVTLIADMMSSVVQADGLLTVDGDIRAYGVSGGGALKLESGTAVVVGGKVLETEGVLGAGEMSAVDLILAEDYLLKAGEALPMQYAYQANVWLPGEKIVEIPPVIQGVVLADDWTPPYPSAGRLYIINTDAGPVRILWENEMPVRPTLPKGTVISMDSFYARNLVGYTIPANVFPQGLPAIIPIDKVLAAGMPAPSDLLLAAGTQIQAGSALTRAAAVKPLLTIDPGLLRAGFSNYDITGHNGLVVGDGAQLDVTMPVYRLTASASGVATGADPDGVLELWTPPTYQADPVGRQLIQRAGANLSLTSMFGPLTVAEGARITVDPGQSILLSGRDRVVVDGELNAWGGLISVKGDYRDVTHPGLVWIGESAVLDVAARAVTATDPQGLTYGLVADGGEIRIGGGVDWEETGESAAPDAFVVIRPGAVLDASGTRAVLDILAGGANTPPVRQTVASDGGLIAISSSIGLHLDGTIRAMAGGEGAAGGTLALALESPNYETRLATPDILRHREFVLAQQQGGSLISEDATALDIRDELVTGAARFGVDRIEAGGFDDLSLLVDGLLSFDGDIDLTMGRSLRFYAGAYGLSENAGGDARISLAAPYVRLAGVTRFQKDGYTLPFVGWRNGPSQRDSEAVFSVAADLIDLRDRVGFGARGTVDLLESTYEVDQRGFALVDLTSRGDLRVLGGLPGRGLSGGATTELATPGDINLTAAQIYPGTGAGGGIIAGYTTEGDMAEGSVLNIRRYGDGDVAMPFSAFGALSFSAETINQGGVVRAPLGIIRFGGIRQFAYPDIVNLLPGSVTSVSGAGLILPYGGTIDGLSYTYNGVKVVLNGVGNPLASTISFQSSHVNAEAGSTLDLSGGGELLGAGFVSGRGGSVDILTTPLTNAGPGYQFSSAQGQVYAIVPSSSAAYAPVAPEAGYGAPQIGRRITIPAGVPGLPAGVYTLMPSTYALLPGAFRVEIGQGQSSLFGVASVGNGSYVAAGYLGTANTTIRDALPSQVLITPGSVVRTHSSYNEMGYNAFVRSDAARLGVPRALLTSDAGTLDLNFFLAKPDEADQRPVLVLDGEVLLKPEDKTDGYGSTVTVRGVSEILASGQAATLGLSGVSLEADVLNALEAPRLILNGALTSSYGQGGRFVSINEGADAVGGDGKLVVRTGARLSAAEVILVGNHLTIEEGASISTIGKGASSFDSSDGYVFTGSGVLAVSNGWLNLLLQPAGGGSNAVIDIGACVTDACNGTTQLVSDGTIAIALEGALTIEDNVSYGTKNLVLGLSAVNLGENAALAAAAAAGQLPDGLAMNQSRLAQLLAGNTATGAPKLETLVLNARDAVNIFGSVSLDTLDPATGVSSLERLVLGTPAIYGYGAAGDVASIRTGEFIWTGMEGAPGAAMAGMLGDGVLDITARAMLFGYGPDTQPSSTAVDDRLTLGFSRVNLNASERITSTGKGSLSVHHRQGEYVTGKGYVYEGGDLAITTALLTGEAGSINRISAGGALTVTAPSAPAGAAATSDPLGATLELSGRSIAIDTAVVLPSGRLVLAATDDITLGDGARLDLSGREVTMFDAKKYSWGGDLLLTSTTGDIRQAAGSVVDLSARYNRGGSLTATALGVDGGHVDLAGRILGSASGEYDAGGTFVPYDAAEIAVRAQTLADFAGLNGRLTDGGVFGARRFQIKQGDLTVGDEVKARIVEIVLDGGDLTVNGRIDASGVQVGAIRLAAMGDLTVNGVLDAHGTGLRVDSYGRIIDSPNRASVELTTREGRITLSDSARVDLRAGTESALGDGRARGALDLIAPRIGADDVAIDVLGALDVAGAKTVAVYGLRSYDDAPLALTPDVTGERPQIITQAYLDVIDGHSRSFIDAALGNGSLGARLAGLGDYHLRPGVEILGRVSAENPNGDLTVAGDLDLSGYRYGPDADRDDPARRGFGEPGMLLVRAAGDINVHGSISDGFAPPPATPDDAEGWVLSEGDAFVGGMLFGGDVVVPIDGVVLDVGTRFPLGSTLNYDAPVAAMTLPAGTVLPVDVVLAGNVSLPAGAVVAANIYNEDGSLAHAAGSVLQSDVTLHAGMTLGAGTPLRAGASVAAMTWPKGVPLPVEMTVTSPIALARGSFIPSMTHLELPGDQPIDLRPTVDGVQGRNWAVAPMLPEGTASWALTLAAGADLESADRRALNPESSGSVKLADTHYVMGFTTETIGGDTLVWAEGNFFGYPAGTPVSADETFWCEIDPSQCTVKRDYVWAEGNILGMTPGTPVVEADLMWCEFFPESCQVVGGTVVVTGSAPAAPAFSVVRTGTGDLEILAAGDVRMDSLYGVYTAGTATEADAVFNRPRGMTADGTPLGPQPVDYDPALELYRAWYPDQGGDVLISAGRDLIGDVMGADGNGAPGTAAVGGWLWRQGSGTAATDETIPTAWWINFGSYIARLQPSGALQPQLAGFTGIGALGGGDVTIRVGGDAGAIDLRGYQGGFNSVSARSQALVIAVGATGRVSTDGVLTLTGGGDIDMRIAGGLNPVGDLNADAHERHAINGAVTNVRGATHIGARSMGAVQTAYRNLGFVGDPIDLRAIDPFARSYADARSGLVLVPGDSAMYLETLGGLVWAGAGDPGRALTPNRTGFAVGGTAYDRGGQSWFSLWTDHTAINLVSAGGDMAPGTRADERRFDGSTSDITDTLPSILRVAALSGDLFFGVSARPFTVLGSTTDILRPSASAELEILAAGSIHAGQRTFADPPFGRHAIILSGSATPLPTPFNPAFVGGVDNGPELVSNLSREVIPTSDNALFVFGWNSASDGLARAAGMPPIRLYAVNGDIVGLGTGRTTADAVLTLYEAGAPVWMKAGRDIVSTGNPPGEFISGDFPNPPYRGNLIVHNNATDVSIVSAGRDILYANFDIAGPGSLEVSAGRNIVQEGKGSFHSIGPVAVGDTRPGASISLMAGMADGVDWTAVRTRYLDPANLADPVRPLAEQPGKAAKTYEAELSAWLGERYGFEGTTAEALAYFDALGPEQQRIFLRQVYFAETREGGREYNDPDSSRFASYLRGREMIATLFPDKDKDGEVIDRTGDIIMFGGSGVRTDFGGDIEMMAPGGQIVVGVQGVVPPASSGIITQGQGDIRLFSEKSLLLGLSRIMTTFGGSIFAWSEEGDINAGRGSKTTILFTPPRRTYDAYGNIRLAPQAPSSGAGIATLNPIPEVAPGDIDLIAPLGTIDAGEAGIRVSGNINLAALQVLNAANIQVQGDAKGIPLPPVVNTGALTAASSASTAVVAQAARAAEQARPARVDPPSIITSRFLGFGE